MDFKFTYTKRNNDFKQENLFLNQIPTNQLVLDNSSDARMAEFRVDFSQPLNLFDKGKSALAAFTIDDILLPKAEELPIWTIRDRRRLLM